jgi:hypothetical protein
LQQGEFIIHTDHKSLDQLNEQRLHTVWQHKVFSKLLGLQYKIVYIQGSENCVADALSRRVHDDGELGMISAPVPQWSQLVQNSYKDDDTAQGMIAKLSLDGTVVPNYTLKDGLLR